jgi:two-component system OmpR family sensor kinase
MTPRSLKGRLTLLVALAGLVAVAALTAGFNLLLRSSLDTDANRVLAARASAALESVDVAGGRVKVRDAPDEAAADSGVWIYDHGQALERPPAPAAVQSLADALVTSGHGFADSEPLDLRLHAVPIEDGSSAVGTVVVALSVEPYERSANRALVASLIFAGLLLLLLIASTRLVVGRALSPVARMTAEAADWSEHDLDHRFNLGPPRDELTRLASTFDSMLARLAANLRHEQRLTAEVSHELRTPLAAIAAEAELALRRPRGDEEYRGALAGIQRKAAQLAAILETLLATARNEANATAETADANTIAERAIDSFREGVGDGHARVELQRTPRPVRVDAGLATASQILAPLLENAGRYGRGRVDVEVQPSGENVVFSIRDNGPGIAPSEREQIFEPGSRGAAAGDGTDQGAGLGLALSRRLARAVGGDVVAPDGDNGGLVQATIPLAHP